MTLFLFAPMEWPFSETRMSNVASDSCMFAMSSAYRMHVSLQQWHPTDGIVMPLSLAKSTILRINLLGAYNSITLKY